ncbi:MAG TPA: peptidoglycan -binding protein [Alphaproteobacteria bacterium]|jgi:chemotaxis protein MotB
MAGLARRRPAATADIWPGFVDALAALLMVIIFLLTVFVLAQFFLSDLLAGRDQALRRLEAQVAELADMLSLERRASDELRSSVAELSAQLQASTGERDALSARAAELAARADRAEADAERLARQLEEARKEVEVGRETVRLKLLEIASLNADIEALRKLRRELEERVGSLAEGLEAAEKETGALRDRTKALEARLADERERTVLAQKELEARDIRIEELTRRLAEREDALGEEKRIAAARQSQVERLSNQIEALRAQLARIAKALEASEAKVEKQRTTIANLGRRLNLALVSKVEELARYRSEFFGRLREVLGDRPDIRIVGDRFVFQSEVLFKTGEASLNDAGREQIRRLAKTLLEISPRIPDDIDWILRVDGHTDIRPIATAEFPSNWELSTARALSVVRELTDQGVPPKRLAAAGFGPYQPIDPGTGEAAFQRNRRIEFKLTER